ncbi:uncharacterized protein Z520_03395 [Fonsecaea multimorphosa CBS 102226]|uniref:Uncharacterized protein n=1 Tax=Fonsecaea multimorphosa CBS 102226 TaxID=1442371 RepID=A0A0D2KC95_9EURO|nr:uncharacterized protein Z520_03395 [Fonsecaea multimorphosa CBS 102226]KIY00730.1 hypothetical protein Z520_03395 [Fonsecaea multimorphosa CBS 102226]OAL27774.1 hypothetical protein AYO22_03316 [Fonsecaea multimorphosa]
MAVFKKKPKAKDDTYIIPPAASSDPALPTKLSRSLKRKQKNVVEPKPEIDLATVLPDKNDFRTSLLMPGLSARFSMLREQDDPTTKVGKASDDSVLFPKRASRLNLFSHNPLTDIAETESIQTAFRAPFSDEDRSYSFSEGAGYASDDAGSVLARTRPVDGNNLFGGRQKMYRIPTASGSGSSKDLTETSAPLISGRHVYQNDVVLSPYQQMRLKAREGQEREESRERPASAGAEEPDRSSVINTPSTGFSKSRGTTSSTASGPSNRRTSTAATSVVSDTPHPRQSNTSASSNNRMQGSEYGSEENLLKRNFSSDSRKGFQGMDHHAQPPLPMSPSNSRQLFQSSSVSNLADKYAHGASSFSANTLRAASPTPALQSQALASLDFGLKSSNNHPRRYQTASPTNDEDDGSIYKQSLQPNDRGKATAMGLFNRPQQQFDEAKFQERQLQMHEGRISPPASDGPDYGGIAERQHAPGRVVLPTIPTSPFKTYRGRDSGSTSVTSRSRAQSTASSVNPAQVQAQVEALIRRQNEEYSTLQTQRSTTAEPNRPSAASQPPKSLREQPAASRGTFFDTFDGSDEDDADSPMLGRYEPAPRLAPLDVHPALRDGSQAFDFGDHVSAFGKPGRPQSNVSADTSSPSVTHDTPDTSDSLHRASHTKASDSPTFGPTTGLGLSGLIRTHLRHDSDRSSVMPPPSPGQPPYQSNFSISPLRDREPSGVSVPTGNYRGSVREREPSVASTQPGNYPPSLRDREPSVASTARTTNPPESTHSDPWEFDNAHRTVRSPLEPVHDDAIPAMSQKAQQILGQAISHKNQASSKTQQVLGDDAPGSGALQHPANRAFPSHDALPHHQRGESTETQKEFGNELAERARRIQGSLKGVAEAEKRSRSQDRHNPAAQALHALRHKTSKTSLGPRANEPQPKAMKMLGIGVSQKPEPMGRSPNVGARGDWDFEQGYDEHDNRPTPRQRPAEFEPPSGRRTPGFSRPGPGPGHGAYPINSNEDPERRYQRSATPTSGRARRDRAESEAAERSRSRTGRYREEPPYSPGEYGRTGPPHLPLHREQQQRPYGPPDGSRGYPGPHPSRVPLRGPPPVDPRTFERSASAMSNRQPSATRAGPAGFYDGRAATPTMGGTPQLGSGPMQVGAPRPSPRPPFPHSPISPFTSPPGVSPGLSGPASGVLSALPSPSGQPPSGRFTPVEGRSTPAGSRKKSVTKGMISEPTFISSTSSVPLVGLPNGPRPTQIASPPIPSMNPRRRGNTMTDRPDGYPSPRMPASQMTAMPDSPGRGGGLPISGSQRAYFDQQQQVQQKPPPRPRNRLRKISSEGGSMAARARNQAMMSEFGHERLRSPAMPVFPNRSTTSLSIHQDGGMF